MAVIRDGERVAMGNPGELRARAGGPGLEILGRGFEDNVLNLLRAHPGVVAAEVLNERLTIGLREGRDAAPLVSLVVSAGIQVEEVRRSKASLEEIFLTLMEEEK